MSRTDAPSAEHPKRPKLHDDVFTASPSTSGSSSHSKSSPVALYSSPVTPASSTASSSPLSRFKINRRVAHIPTPQRLMAAKAKPKTAPPTEPSTSTSYKHPNSPLLQRVHQALVRLDTTCSMCWVAGEPNPASHAFHSCPRLQDDNSELEIAFKSFRSGFDVPSGICFGCFVPKVCQPHNPMSHHTDVHSQVPFSTSSNQTDKLPPQKHQWTRYCPHCHVVPLAAWWAISQPDVMDSFKRSPQYCCGLDLDRGEHADYPGWLFKPCPNVASLQHAMRVFEFMLDLRGMPPAS